MLKTERLTVKILPADKAALEQQARAEGESVAVLVRRLIRGEVQRQMTRKQGDIETTTEEKD